MTLQGNDKIYKRVALAVIIFYLIVIFVSYNIAGLNNYKANLLDENIKVKIVRADGSIEEYDSNYFATVSGGDQLQVTISLPEEYRIPQAALCFQMYNSIVSLKYEGKELYRYGDERAAKGRQIGNVYPRIKIPDEAFGNELMLECFITERHTLNHITNMTILPLEESHKYFLIAHLSVFVIFISLLLGSEFLFFILLFCGYRSREIRTSICLALFTNFISAYILAYYGMINIISNNIDFNANLEYVVLFLMPIPVVCYFGELIQGKKLKRQIQMVALVFTGFFVVCTLLNFTTSRYHYSYFVTMLHVMILIGIIIVARAGRMERQMTYQSNAIMQKGMRFFLGLTVVELIRFNIDKYFTLDMPWLPKTLLPIGFIMLITILGMENINRITNAYKDRQEMLQLEKMAFIDSLTGILNRAKCQEYLDKLKKEEAHEYTIIFADLNELKAANDKYGHKAGDEYIQTAVRIFRKYFRNADVCGRMGGDEFIIIYGGKFPGELKLLLQNMQDEFTRVNESGQHQFTMSVACGSVTSTLKDPIEISTAVALADKRMYENKLKMKSGH